MNEEVLFKQFMEWLKSNGAYQDSGRPSKYDQQKEMPVDYGSSRERKDSGRPSSMDYLYDLRRGNTQTKSGNNQENDFLSTIKKKFVEWINSDQLDADPKSQLPRNIPGMSDQLSTKEKIAEFYSPKDSTKYSVKNVPGMEQEKSFQDIISEFYRPKGITSMATTSSEGTPIKDGIAYLAEFIERGNYGGSRSPKSEPYKSSDGVIVTEKIDSKPKIEKPMVKSLDVSVPSKPKIYVDDDSSVEDQSLDRYYDDEKDDIEEDISMARTALAKARSDHKIKPNIKAVLMAMTNLNNAIARRQ